MPLLPSLFQATLSDFAMLFALKGYTTSKSFFLYTNIISVVVFFSVEDIGLIAKHFIKLTSINNGTV